MVTLDTTMLGWRTRDLDIAYLPFLRGKGIAQYTSDPVFRRIIAEEPAVLGQGRAAQADAGGAAHARAAHARLPRPVRAEPALGRRARRGADVHADLLAPVADLGEPAVPARAHEAADPAQGHPAPRRRAPRGRRGHRRHRRLQPRRPPGRRRDLDDRGAAGDRRGGRRPDPDRPRLRRALAAPTRSRRSRSARPRSGSGARTPTAWRSPARPACARCCRTSRPTSTSRSGLVGLHARSPTSGPRPGLSAEPAGLAPPSASIVASTPRTSCAG